MGGNAAEHRSPELLLLGLTVFAVGMLAYVTSLPGNFHYDDFPTILQNPAVRDPGLLGRYFTDPNLFSGLKDNAMYRPVLLVTYLADYLLFGFRPLGWHLTNVLLHALNALLVVLLAARLLRVFSPEADVRWPAFLAGAAFVLHPVHSEVANYVSSRSGAIATAGFLGAFLLHLSWTRGGRGGAARAAAAAGSALLLAVGLGGKEIAVALVPAVFVLEILDPRGGRALRRLSLAAFRTLPVLVTAAGYLYVRKQVLGTAVADVAGRFFTVKGKADPFWGGGRTVYQNLLTQACVFWDYVRLLLFPTDLAVDRFFPVYTSFARWPVWPSVAGLAVLGAALVAAARRKPLVTLCGAIFFFGLAPTSSLVPLNVVMNEHRLYLPGVGFAVLTGLVLARVLAARPRAGAVLLAAAGACCLAVIVPRNLLWQDPRALWADNVRVSPRSFRAHNQLGTALLEEARRAGEGPEAVSLLDRAIEEFRVSEELYPDWYHAHLNLGIAYRERGRISGEDADFEKSLEHLRRCAALSKNRWRARYQIATTYGTWKKYDEAIRRFSAMAEEDREGPDAPRKTLYLFPLARLNLERGRLDLAEKLYREILAVAPGDRDAKLGLARTLREAGRPGEGLRILTRLLREEPGDPYLHVAMARFLSRLDPPDRRGAAAHFQRALRLGYVPTPREADRYLR